MNRGEMTDMMRQRKLIMVKLTNRTQAIVDVFREQMGEGGFQDYINTVIEQMAQDLVTAAEEGKKAGLYGDDVDAEIEALRKALAVPHQ